MKKKLFLFSIFLLFVTSFSFADTVTTPQSKTVEQKQVYEISVNENVPVPMRDGVNLMANIFQPKSEETFPVIITRSPYGKGNSNNPDGRYFASKGYVYFAQDCRGTGTSEGKWYPGVNERNDGKDTHKWVLSQPWCNGSIGTTGGSYVGYTQWIVAPDAGDSLKAMFTVVPLFDWYTDCAYIGGASSYSKIMGWGTAMAKPPKGHPGLDWNKWNQNKAYLYLPLLKYDEQMGFEVPYLQDWIAHPQFDSYWQQLSISDSLDKITAPNLTITGWYDLFITQAFDNISRIKKESTSQLARQNQYLLVGPWAHGIGPKVGELDFGEKAKFDHQIQEKWFNYWLKGTDTGINNWAPIRLFVMGTNQWRDEQQWPLARTKYTPYYLHSTKGANSITGDGTLNTTVPAEEPADKFVYDPADPVPTHGGCNLSIPAGAFDQTEIEKRKDVLVFTSETLKNDLEVTGPVKVILYAASSATDTDWTAKLVDVHPDGRAMNICDGIIRARYRNKEKVELIEPDKIYRYEIDLWSTSNVFLKGHRIRVEISSSNFPRFDRNPNTGHTFGADAELIKANQQIYHDRQHPSHILLPVIP